MSEATLGLLAPFSHGRGFQETSVVTSPAAGLGFTITIPGKYYERVQALTFTLVTGSNAANRAVLLSVLDGNGNTVLSIPAAAVQTASLTRTYSYLANMSNCIGPIGGAYLSPAPALFLQPAQSLVVTIGAVDAADQISAIVFNRERFDTGPAGYEMGATATLDDRRELLMRLADVLA